MKKMVILRYIIRQPRRNFSNHSLSAAENCNIGSQNYNPLRKPSNSPYVNPKVKDFRFDRIAQPIFPKNHNHFDSPNNVFSHSNTISKSRDSFHDEKRIAALSHNFCTTTKIPFNIKEKIVSLLQNFGHKRDAEAFAKYLQELYRARTSTEPPSVLPSRFLPEVGEKASLFESESQENGEDGESSDSGAGKDKDNCSSTNESKATQSEKFAHAKRLAMMHTEDSKHKLYRIFYSPVATLGYIGLRYTLTYGSNFRVLSEIKKRCTDFKPASMLDYGCGPGVSISAAVEVFNKGNFDNTESDYKNFDCGSFTERKSSPLTSAIALDPSKHMLQVAKHLITAQAKNEREFPRVDYQLAMNFENTNSSFSNSAQNKFDLITLSYVLLDISGQPSRDMLVRRLWNKLNDNGMLVIIERGTPSGFRLIHHARELFIDEIGPSGFHFVAPCSHEGRCPLALTGRDWCHFGQQTAKEFRSDVTQ